MKITPEVVILDLDGPVLDGSPRQYALYAHLLTERGYVPADFATYWHWKRERTPLADYLAVSGAEAIAEWFGSEWLNRIESDEWLMQDTVQPGARETLTDWQARGLRLIVATQRRNERGVISQLNRLELLFLFETVLVCPHHEGMAGKVHRVRTTLGDTPMESCVFIGDTEIDIDAARALGCPVYAVTCGVRSREFLEARTPDFIVEHLSEVHF